MCLAVVTHVKTIGITPVGEHVQITDQTRLQFLTRHRLIDGLTVDLGGTRNIVVGFGTAFDLERINTDFSQSFDMLDPQCGSCSNSAKSPFTPTTD